MGAPREVTSSSRNDGTDEFTLYPWRSPSRGSFVFAKFRKGLDVSGLSDAIREDARASAEFPFADHTYPLGG